MPPEQEPRHSQIGPLPLVRRLGEHAPKGASRCQAVCGSCSATLGRSSRLHRSCSPQSTDRATYPERADSVSVKIVAEKRDGTGPGIVESASVRSTSPAEFEHPSEPGEAEPVRHTAQDLVASVGHPRDEAVSGIVVSDMNDSV